MQTILGLLHHIPRNILILRLILQLFQVPLAVPTITTLDATTAVEITKLIVLQDAVGDLRQVQDKDTAIGALDADHVALVVEDHVEGIPGKGVRMQHALHRKVDVRQLEEHLVEQLEGNCCNATSHRVTKCIH